MKFKYYLRGAGVGMIVTTLIFAIALLRYKPTLSADEIREQATKLGMVMQEETASGNAETKESTKNEGSEQKPSPDQDDSDTGSPAEADASTQKDATKTDDQSTDTKQDSEAQSDREEEVTTVRFVVKGGQFSDVVSNNLAAKGLVPDGEEYNKWLMRHHYDKDILPGVYYIKSDATFKEIAEMLTTEQE